MKKIVALFIVVVIVVAGWSAAWFYVAGEVRRNVGLLADANGTTDPRLTCAGLEVSGFPFRMDVTCSGAALQQGDVSLDAAEVRASVMVYSPTHAQVFLRSPLRVADAFSGLSGELRWSSLHASARLDGFSIARISVVGDSLEWVDTITGETTLATASHLEAHLLDKPADRQRERGLQTLDAFVGFRNLVAPGIQVASGELAATAEISAVPDDIRSYGDSPGPLRRIADAGGELRLLGFEAKDGATSFTATGALHLDAQMRPEGEIAMTAKGLVERMGDIIPEPMKTLLVGTPGPDGAYAQTLNIRQGVVLAGLVPVGVVPPLM